MAFRADVPVLLASTTLGSAAASITVSSIPQTYNTIKLIWAARSTTVTMVEYPYVRFNGDSTSKYYRWNGAGGTEWYLSSISGTTNWFTGFAWNELIITGYANTSYKACTNRHLWNNSTTANNIIVDETSAIYTGTSGISSVTLYASFASGSTAFIYGYP